MLAMPDNLAPAAFNEIYNLVVLEYLKPDSGYGHCRMPNSSRNLKTIYVA